MKKISTLLTILCAAALSAGAKDFPEDIQKTNIFHAYNWKFTDVLSELPAIKEAGYGAVQVSPVQGNCSINTEWFYAYLPYDFAYTANGNGARSTLKKLCEKAEEFGIKIIVDVVANHMNPKSSNRDSWWESNDRLRDTGGINYSSRHSITHGNLGEYQDVNSENPEVQERAKAFIEDLRDAGVKGIRWDAAKHIGLPSEDCDFWSKMAEVDGLWFYGEILDNPGGNNVSHWNVMKEYAEYMSVTDNGVSSRMLNMFRSEQIPPEDFQKSNPIIGGVPADKIIYWGESHDTYSNEGGATKNINQSVIDRIYMWGACRKDQAALYLSRPSKTGYKDIKMGVKGSTNGLTSEAIKAVNNFRLNTIDIDEAIDFSYGKKGWFINARKDNAAFIMLPKAMESDINITNPQGYLPEGKYTDYVSGTEFTVTPSSISGHIGPHGVAVLYVHDPSGVTDIEAEDTNLPEIWYDLTGNRVANPDKGIYIRVKGNKAQKIIL